MQTISFYDEVGKITGELSGNAVVYEISNDQPDHPVVLNPDLPPFPTAKRQWVEGAWFGKDVYVVDGVVTDRPVCPATLDGYTLNSLPVPCEIKVNNSTYPCDESSATLSFNQPGTYSIKVIAWPYLDGEFSIVNPA
jgi:hypothetical protein